MTDEELDKKLQSWYDKLREAILTKPQPKTMVELRLRCHRTAEAICKEEGFTDTEGFELVYSTLKSMANVPKQDHVRRF